MPSVAAIRSAARTLGQMGGVASIGFMAMQKRGASLGVLSCAISPARRVYCHYFLNTFLIFTFLSCSLWTERARRRPSLPHGVRQSSRALALLSAPWRTSQCIFARASSTRAWRIPSSRSLDNEWCWSSRQTLGMVDTATRHGPFCATEAQSGITTCARFPDQLNSDTRPRSRHRALLAFCTLP